MSRQAAPPPELDGFEFRETLGSGGFADVYRYLDLALRRDVAIKVLRTHLGRATQRTFEAEVRMMAQLSSHPHVVNIYYPGRASTGAPYLVMEYCPPPSLGEQIKAAARPMSLPRVLEIGVRVAGAVHSAHGLDILHRDIKPANILFTRVGQPALTDFGISSQIAGDHRGHGASVPWAPPEQLGGRDAREPDSSSDVYSLAATMWTMLAGHSPFFRHDGPNDPAALGMRVRSDPVPRLPRDDVPDSVKRLLTMAMAKRPDERFGTAAEFARLIQGEQRGLLIAPTEFVDFDADRSRWVHDHEAAPPARRPGSERGLREHTGGSDPNADAPVRAGDGAGARGRGGRSGATPIRPDADPANRPQSVGKGPRGEGPSARDARGPEVAHPAGEASRSGGIESAAQSYASSAPDVGEQRGLARGAANGVSGTGPGGATGESASVPPESGDQGEADLHLAETVLDPRRSVIGSPPDSAPPVAPETFDGLPGQAATRIPLSGRARTLVACGIIVAVLGAGYGLTQFGPNVLGSTGPSTTQTFATNPKDMPTPSPEIVPSPAGLVWEGPGWEATWSNPDPRDNDTYRYRLYDPGRPSDKTTIQTTDEMSATIAPDDPYTCLEVRIRRSNGTQSQEPETECAS